MLQVDQLRADVARYQTRLAELENDFLSLDVVANTEVGAGRSTSPADSQAYVVCVLSSVCWAWSSLHVCFFPCACLQVTEYDAELRKAWFTAAAFKKR